MATTDDLSKVANEIRQSKKYANLSFETVSRIVKWSAQRYLKLKEIDRNARKKLHQVYGAFLSQSISDSIVQLNNIKDFNKADIKPLFLDILKLHNSTKERVPLLSLFYRKIFEGTGKVERIIDIGCGLNPFTYPWIIEAFGEVTYYGYDIDLESTNQMNTLFHSLNFSAGIMQNDIFFSIPTHEASDLVFLFKILPCLEQQEKGISQRIFTNLKCKKAIVSFPSVSLGGKEKGMREFYENFLLEIIKDEYVVVQDIIFKNESIYILEKKYENSRNI